jgi:hypothetical protein
MSSRWTARFEAGVFEVIFGKIPRWKFGSDKRAASSRIKCLLLALPGHQSRARFRLLSGLRQTFVGTQNPPATPAATSARRSRDIERWRSATMSHKAGADDDFRDATLAPRDEFAPPQSAYALDPGRFKLLKKPLDGV